MYLILCFTFACVSLKAGSDFTPPKIKESSDVLGHIFKDDKGHIKQDTPENRAFIEAATTSPENKVGTKASGTEIYLKTMPDGTQAWAEVWGGEIRNGGKNSFPKEWVSDSSNYKGGYFATPKFSDYNSNKETFNGHLVVNKLKETYEAFSQTPQLTTLHPRKTQGVSGRYGKILDLLDSSEQEGKHTLLVPTYELSEKESLQILREVARGVYVHEALPFFSLHFNQTLTSYPVIHPGYRNTLIGNSIAMLDYYMKGFVNGCFFEEDFIEEWGRDRNKTQGTLLDHTVDFHEYCENLGFRYRTFNEILEETIDTDAPRGTFHNCFNITYRIIAKQNAIYKSGETLSFEGDFDIIGIVNGNPTNESEAKHYDTLRKTCNLMCAQIKEILPQLPICKKYFQVLYLSNFCSYYCNSLKESCKIPLLDRELDLDPKNCPAAFPPIPISLKHELQISFKEVFRRLSAKGFQTFLEYCRSEENPSDDLTDEVFISVYEVIEPYSKSYGLSRGMTEDECGDFTADILIYCRKRYQNVKRYTRDILRNIRVAGSEDDPQTYKRFLTKVNQVLMRSYGADRAEILRLREELSLWFTDPVAYSFKETGIMFSVLDGSLKIISDCTDDRLQVAGGCGIVVEDMNTQGSMFLGYFHQGIKIQVPYGNIEVDSPEEIQAGAVGHLYPPLPGYPLNNAILNILQSLSHQDVALFEKNQAYITEWDFIDPQGVSLVHHAATSENPYFLKHLIEKNAPLNRSDPQGLTPLHYAAQSGSIACIHLLLQQVPQLLETKAQDGETPLFRAVQKGISSSTQALLKAKANPNCKIVNDMTPLLWAIQSSNEDVALTLLGNKKVDIDAYGPDKATAVEVAVEMQLALTLKRLIEVGGEVNRMHNGYTAIHVATSIGWLEGVEILTDCPDTQINLPTSAGATALTLAKQGGFTEIEELLIQRGAQ